MPRPAATGPSACGGKLCLIQFRQTASLSWNDVPPAPLANVVGPKTTRSTFEMWSSKRWRTGH